MGKLISSDCNRRSEREDGAGGGVWGGGGVQRPYGVITKHDSPSIIIFNIILRRLATPFVGVVFSVV